MMYKKSYHIPTLCRFSPVFSFKSFMFFTYHVTICSQLRVDLVIQCEVKVKIYIFWHGCSIYVVLIFKWSLFPPVYCSIIFIIIQCPHMCWSISGHCILFIYLLFILVLISHYLSYYSSYMGQYKSSSIFFLINMLGLL